MPGWRCRASDPATEAHLLLPAEIEDVHGIVASAAAASFQVSLPVDRCAIVTSSPRRLAPQYFLLEDARLGQRIEDCLAFEDIPGSIQAAEAAGSTLAVGASHTGMRSTRGSRGSPTTAGRLPNLCAADQAFLSGRRSINRTGTVMRRYRHLKLEAEMDLVAELLARFREVSR